MCGTSCLMGVSSRIELALLLDRSLIVRMVGRRPVCSRSGGERRIGLPGGSGRRSAKTIGLHGSLSDTSSIRSRDTCPHYVSGVHAVSAGLAPDRRQFPIVACYETVEHRGLIGGCVWGVLSVCVPPRNPNLRSRVACCSATCDKLTCKNESARAATSFVVAILRQACGPRAF